MAAHVTREEFNELKEHVGTHDVLLAVQGTNQTTMQKSLDSVIAELVKTRWTLIGLAITIATASFGVVIGT